MVDARTSSIRPERVCISVAAGIIEDNAASSAWMTTSMPSPRMLRSASVTSTAISMSLSALRSRPVISQSIHTSSSRTGLTLSRRATSSRPYPPAGPLPSNVRAMTSESTATPAQQIAACYATQGPALELGTVVVDGTCDPTAQVRIPLATVNRHGMVAGATGTGKTKTLQVIAEQLSAAGVPVVMADIKGDLSGLSRPGEADDKTGQRAKDTGDAWTPTAFPVEFLSIGTSGIGVSVRATMTSFGPILLSKVLGLNPTQESTLGLIFHWADQKGLALLDLKDLRAVIQFLTSDEGKEELKAIGAVSAATAGVILRALINREAEGADTFFGEPELEPSELMRLDAQGRGIITLLELGDQAARPVMFSTFLMWVLADLFTALPEVGDVDKPKLVFIFDEAHLLFTDASKAFLEQVEQTVKLIRSKGVGVFFCTQLPTDVPNDVLSQLGARIQHALRAFTPDDQKALTKTVRTYPKTDVYDLEKALTSLGIGEAIVTVLSEKGAPTPVAWTRMRSPRSLMGAIGNDAIAAAAKASALQAKYGQTNDPQSAYEILQNKVAPPRAGAPALPPPLPVDTGAASASGEVTSRGAAEPGMLEKVMGSAAFKSAMRSAGTVIGREIT